MGHPEQELSKTLCIINDLGLHARAAEKIAKIASGAAFGVWIAKDGNRVDAASIIDILTLSCAKDTKITLTIDDPSDIDVLAAIEDNQSNAQTVEESSSAAEKSPAEGWDALDRSYVKGGKYSGDDLYDPAAFEYDKNAFESGLPEGGYSGDDDYDPAAGGLGR